MINKYNTIGKKLYWVPLVERPMSTLLYCDEHVECLHELTHLCVQKMNIYKNIDALFDTWDVFLNLFKEINPHAFLKEFAILLFSLYKNFFIEMSVCAEINRVSLLDIVNLYDHIVALPLTELLDVLDECYEQFVDTMNQCNIQQTATWSEWIVANWWVPPVVTVALAYSVIHAQITNSR